MPRPNFRPDVTAPIDQPVLGPPRIVAVAGSRAPKLMRDVYSKKTHKWAANHLLPPGYGLRLQLTDTNPTVAKPIFWHVESLDGRYPAIDVRQTTPGFKLKFPFGGLSVPGVAVDIPVPGPVRITAKHGQGPEFEQPAYPMRDFLVVSIGDSFSCGQGNPDQPGLATAKGKALCEMTTLVALADKLHQKLLGVPILGDAVKVLEKLGELPGEFKDAFFDLLSFGDDDPTKTMEKPPEWLEPLAWRSLQSSPAQAARAAARESFGRLITFVSVAQSGAGIGTGLLKPQRGFVKVGQIDEVRQLLADPRDHRDNPRFVRPIDVLIMSIGGNDVGFAGTLADMTTEKNIIGMFWGRGASRTEIQRTILGRLKDLPSKYDKLADAINKKLKPKAVLIPEYPTSMFDDKNGKPADGCDFFDFTGPMGIQKNDAELIEEMGNRLNDVIRAAADKHGWTVATGVAADFKRHGYCSESSWWVFAEQSCKRQGDLEGTMHPNTAGTLAVAKRLGVELNTILGRLSSDATAGVRTSTTRRPSARPARRRPAKTI